MSTSEPVFKEDDKCVALADVRWDEYAWDKLVHELCSTITSKEPFIKIEHTVKRYLATHTTCLDEATWVHIDKIRLGYLFTNPYHASLPTLNPFQECKSR